MKRCRNCGKTCSGHSNRGGWYDSYGGYDWECDICKRVRKNPCIQGPPGRRGPAGPAGSAGP
uniref:hypothetical protein n=1 Tax=Bacillus pumilus TaxID=1408 RepID=UPI001C930EC2